MDFWGSAKFKCVGFMSILVFRYPWYDKIPLQVESTLSIVIDIKKSDMSLQISMYGFESFITI